MTNKKKIGLMAVALSFLFAGFVSGQQKDELQLTLEDSILRALKNNLNLAMSVYDPEIADATLTQAKEVFMPSFQLSYGNQKNENPPYWWLQGAGTIVDKYQDYNVAIAQQIPTGGNISVSLDSYRSRTNQSFQLINPRYGSTMRLDFSQPLLRNFGFKVSRRQILIAQNNIDISENQLRETVLDTIYIVQEAYWNYVYAIENYNVAQQSLKLGRDLLSKNQKEVEVGQLAPIEILNAQATVAAREADLIQAEGLMKRSEEVLKSIINLAAEPDALGKKLTPVDRPEFKPMDISREDALQQALARRPDLKITAKSLESNELNVSVAKNQMLPGLDLKFSYWSPGISGDRLLYLDNNPFLGVIIGTEKGSATDSLRDALKSVYKNWTVGLTLSLPLGNILTRSNYALARLQMRQTMARLKTQVQQAGLEVSDAITTIETNAKRVAATRVARELAQKRLEAEGKKMLVGLTTNYFVLQYQEALATAQSQEIKAVVDYNLALARLEKATGTALESRNIKLSQVFENKR